MPLAALSAAMFGKDLLAISREVASYSRWLLAEIRLTQEQSHKQAESARSAIAESKELQAFWARAMADQGG